jgi:hypothetical protein
MEPKKPRSKTLVFVTVVVIVLLGFALYYVAAIRNSDNRPEGVETQSFISTLPPR